MSTIIKADGTVFVVNTTRTKYSKSKESDFKKIVKSDSQDFGEFVRIEQNSFSGFNVAFSKEAGISTGDYILSTLPKEKYFNSLYAEVVVDKFGDEHHVCVLIVDGRVVGDYDLKSDESFERFNIVFSSHADVIFSVFCAADDNLILLESDNEDAVLFTIPDAQVETKISVIPFIKNAQKSEYEKFELVRFSGNAKSSKRTSNTNPKVTPNKFKLVLNILIIAAGLFFIYFRLVADKEFDSSESNTENQDPYAEYKMNIATMYSPVGILNESTKLFVLAEQLSGWPLVSLKIEGNIYELLLNNNGGDISSFIPLKNEFGDLEVQVQNSTMVVKGAIPRVDRNFPYVLYRNDETEYLLYEEAVIRNGYNISKVGSISNVGHELIQYDVRMELASISELQPFAVFLRDKPIVVNKISMTPSLDRLEIIISITVFGV